MTNIRVCSKCCFKPFEDKLNSISAGFILTSIISVVNYIPNSSLYSVDMAIYTTANSLLLILLAMNNENLLIKSQNQNEI